MPTAAMKKKDRRALIHDPSINGTTEFTDEKLTGMKTGEIALLIAALRGSPDVPRPKDKTSAIELFWRAVEAHPEKVKSPETTGKASRKARETTRKAEGAEGMPEAGAGRKEAKENREKAPRRGKLFSVVAAMSEAQRKAFEGFEPMVKRFAESIREAGRPLTMTECAALLSKLSKTGNPAKHTSWIFCRRMRPAGLLVEERG